MHTFVRHLSVAIVSICLSTPAMAASLFFKAESTAATFGCFNPCYQLLMFYEDSGRDAYVQALQMSLTVIGATVSLLPTPPSTNANASGANSSLEHADSSIVVVPWNLGSTVGRSPDPQFHTLVVDAADTIFSIDDIQSDFDSSISCGPTRTCTIQETALAANRIYLGRFNIMNPGPQVYVQVGGITGSGIGITDPIGGIIRLNGSTFSVAMPAPEPATLAFAGLAIGAILLRRSPQRV